MEIRDLISLLGSQKTVILSTHIMQEVEAICKRVIILNKGAIVANDLTENLSSFGSGTLVTIVVEFSGDPESSVFNGIQGAEKVRKLKKGTWLIETPSGKDIRADLFNTAVKNNLVILSLHRKEKKLEDVFRELTLLNNMSVN